MTPHEARMLKPGDRLRETQTTFWKVQAVTEQGVLLWDASRNATKFASWAAPFWSNLGEKALYHKGSPGKPWWQRLTDPD